MPGDRHGQGRRCLRFAVYGGAVLIGLSISGNMAGNRFLTLLSNMLANLNLTDMECCYKYLEEKRFPESQLKKIDLALSRRLPPKSRNSAAACLKLASLTTAEPTKKERR